MARRSPLLALHQAAGSPLRQYGPAESDVLVAEAMGGTPTHGSESRATNDSAAGIALEYAAIRKHAGLMDLPQRATLVVRGAMKDRHEFLGRMVTQELKGFEPNTVRRSFWLSRKGRIDADLRLIELGGTGRGDEAFVSGGMLMDVDVFAAERTVKGLSAFLFSEDVEIVDATEAFHRLALHGPVSREVLGMVGTPVEGRKSVLELEANEATLVRIGGGNGVTVLVDRQDTTGAVGLELLMPTARAEEVYLSLAAELGAMVGMKARAGDEVREGGRSALARRIGWHAYNIARIEAGTPLYYLDFGPDSLPHETGVLRDRVSFTKGCYLGQEVVARMESLGHPKQRLVALRIADDGVNDDGGAGVGTGTPVLSEARVDGAVVGAVTSSTFLPLAGSAEGRVGALAMVKWAQANAGQTLYVPMGDGLVKATVQESLRFLPN